MTNQKSLQQKKSMANQNSVQPEANMINNNSSTKQPNFGIFVHSYLDEYGLEDHEFRIFSHIVRRYGKDEFDEKTGRRVRQAECFESVPNIAKACKVSLKRTQAAIALLVAAGFLFQVKGGGTGNTHKLTPQDMGLWAKPSSIDQLRSPIKAKAKNWELSKKAKSQSKSSKSNAANSVGSDSVKTDFQAANSVGFDGLTQSVLQSNSVGFDGLTQSDPTDKGNPTKAIQKKKIQEDLFINSGRELETNLKVEAEAEAELTNTSSFDLRSELEPELSFEEKVSIAIAENPDVDPNIIREWIEDDFHIEADLPEETEEDRKDWEDMLADLAEVEAEKRADHDGDAFEYPDYDQDYDWETETETNIPFAKESDSEEKKERTPQPPCGENAAQPNEDGHSATKESKTAQSASEDLERPSEGLQRPVLIQKEIYRDLRKAEADWEELISSEGFADVFGNYRLWEVRVFGESPIKDFDAYCLAVARKFKAKVAECSLKAIEQQPGKSVEEAIAIRISAIRDCIEEYEILIEEAGLVQKAA